MLYEFIGIINDKSISMEVLTTPDIVDGAIALVTGGNVKHLKENPDVQTYYSIFRFNFLCKCGSIIIDPNNLYIFTGPEFVDYSETKIIKKLELVSLNAPLIAIHEN